MIHDGHWYMKEIKESHGLRSFSDVADLLGVTRSAVSRIRKGESISEDTADKIAKLLKANPLVVYAEIMAHSNSAGHDFWRRMLSKVASFLPLGGALAALPFLDNCIKFGQLYILC